jgi:hypothetical protein
MLLMVGCGRGSSQVSQRADTDRLGGLEKQIAELSKHIDALSNAVRGDSAEPDRVGETAAIHSLVDASSKVSQLGNNSNAEKLADCLKTLDDWTVKPEQENDFRQIKLNLTSQLRKKVMDEVMAFQKAALASESGKAGAEKHADAGRTLSLYPMSDDPKVIAEAKRLAAQQAEIAAKLEVLRRQRYNHWATEQIELAIAGYNDTASAIPYRTDRAKLIDLLVTNLGPVDPALLEPAVLDLYNYVIENTKGKIYEGEKTELAKKLTDPLIRRKTLGDF